MTKQKFEECKSIMAGRGYKYLYKTLADMYVFVNEKFQYRILGDAALLAEVRPRTKTFTRNK